MLSVSAGRGGWLRPPALAAALLAPLTLGTPPAGAAPPVRIVACHPESLSDTALANGILGDKPVAPIPDDEANDQDEEDQQPRITGSIPKPADVGEDDSKKLESLGLATVTREQALDKARWAVADPSQRKFRRPKLEGENGWLVWAVETVLLDPSSGPDKELELKVDAGGDGDLLSVECD